MKNPQIGTSTPGFNDLLMISSSEALRIVLENAQPLGSEKVSLLKCLGRTVARDVVAREDLPPFDNSSMDGFAVASSWLKETSRQRPAVLRVIGEASAGRVFGGRIGAAQTVRVMTGGVIPGGADAVVPQEDVIELERGKVAFTRPVSPGQFVRKSGEDIKRGEVVLTTGAILKPASLGVLAALGCSSVIVHRKPRVNIVATGNELVGLLDRPAKGQIRNSTSYGLTGYVLNAGGEPRLMGIARDRGNSLRRKLQTGLRADVLLVTGGVSVGKYDLVRDTLSDLGVDVKFWKVNIKPGKPLLFGVKKGTLVFGLPGNPVSTYVTFLQFAKPALLKMAGTGEVSPHRLSAVLDEDLSKQDGKRHFLRGIASPENGELHVSMTGTQSSGAMSSMVKANCLIVVGEDTMSLRKGDRVEIELV